MGASCERRSSAFRPGCPEFLTRRRVPPPPALRLNAAREASREGSRGAACVPVWPCDDRELEAAARTTTSKAPLNNRLHNMVCAGEVSLRLAQTGIADNWTQLYKKVFGHTADR
jgi:hypothetical protein